MFKHINLLISFKHILLRIISFLYQIQNIVSTTWRNATIHWQLKLKRAIQSSFSHHLVDCVAVKFQWPFSNIRFYIIFFLKKLSSVFFALHMLTVTPHLPHKMDIYVWMWQIWKMYKATLYTELYVFTSKRQIFLPFISMCLNFLISVNCATGR